MTDEIVFKNMTSYDDTVKSEIITFLRYLSDKYGIIINENDLYEEIDKYISLGCG
jgi:hypothetical protein